MSAKLNNLILERINERKSQEDCKFEMIIAHCSQEPHII